MSKPSKIPIALALSLLNGSNRGFRERQNNVELSELEQIAVDNGQLVPLAKCRHFFANDRSFKSFKQNVYVPDRHWNMAITNNPSLRKYAKRFMANKPQLKKKGRPRTKKKVQNYIPVVGDISDADLSSYDSDTSIISIAASDNYDKMDLNFPKPACQAINRVCKQYNDKRRYTMYPRDDSENKVYRMNISFEDK